MHLALLPHPRSHAYHELVRTFVQRPGGSRGSFPLSKDEKSAEGGCHATTLRIRRLVEVANEVGDGMDEEASQWFTGDSNAAAVDLLMVRGG
jgi:hypothetical protein